MKERETPEEAKKGQSKTEVIIKYRIITRIIIIIIIIIVVNTGLMWNVTLAGVQRWYVTLGVDRKKLHCIPRDQLCLGLPIYTLQYTEYRLWKSRKPSTTEYEAHDKR